MWLRTIVVRHFVYGVDARGPEHALDEAEPTEDFVHSALLDECLHLVQHIVAVGEVMIERSSKINARLTAVGESVLRKFPLRNTQFSKLRSVDCQYFSYLVRGHGTLLVRCAICNVAKAGGDVKLYIRIKDGGV